MSGSTAFRMVDRVASTSGLLDAVRDARAGARAGFGSCTDPRVVEITDRVELGTWPAGSTLIVRRERPHPGAQLSFTDHNGYRFQAILTDQTDRDIAIIERRHRQRARVEDRIRDDKDTGLGKLPFKAFAINEVWVEIVMLAHDLLVWTQSAAARRRACRPNRSACATDWPWTEELLAAFQKAPHARARERLSAPAARYRAQQTRSGDRPRSRLPQNQPDSRRASVDRSPPPPRAVGIQPPGTPATPKPAGRITLTHLLHDRS